MEGHREAESTPLAANHEKLIMLGQRRLGSTFTPHVVVTFLNQVLRERGLVAGVRLVDNEYELSIYDTTSK